MKQFGKAHAKALSLRRFKRHIEEFVGANTGAVLASSMGIKNVRKREGIKTFKSAIQLGEIK